MENVDHGAVDADDLGVEEDENDDVAHDDARAHHEQTLERLKEISRQLGEFAALVLVVNQNDPSHSHLELPISDDELSVVLTNFFLLLFEFDSSDQVEAAEECGNSLVTILHYAFSQEDGTIHVDVVEQTLLLLSTLCQVSDACYVLVTKTSILSVCIGAFPVVMQLKDNVHLLDQLLNALPNIVWGHSLKAVEEGVLDPVLKCLAPDQPITLQRGATAVVISLIESTKSTAIMTRLSLQGGVPLLLSTLSRTIPSNASSTDKATYDALYSLSLCAVACILRTHALTRQSAAQFFGGDADGYGIENLRAVVKHAEDLERGVHRWLMAAEILMWLGTVESCRGLLLRVGARKALRHVIENADPYAKWPSKSNSHFSVDAFATLWNTPSVFPLEHAGFLLLWMNRFSTESARVGEQSYLAREALYAEEGWRSFARLHLASPDYHVRHHAHSVLVHLWGTYDPAEEETMKEFVAQQDKDNDETVSSITEDCFNGVRFLPKVVSDFVSEHTRQRGALEDAVGTTSNMNETNSDRQDIEVEPANKISSENAKYNIAFSEEALLRHHLVRPLGFEGSEEKTVISELLRHKFRLPLLSRSSIDLEEVNNALRPSLSAGTRLLVLDGIRQLHKTLANDIKTIETVSRQKQREFTEQSDSEGSRSKLQLEEEKLSEEATSLSPVCFISYCWAQKPKAQHLKRALEAHGINCWMDEQQMEGGSMLFHEIDEGISEARVVISCLSPNYATSVNCNREVLLATERRKAIVPVILESLEQWPPRGNLGPLLAGKLYIDICQGQNMVVQDEALKQVVNAVSQVLKTTAPTSKVAKQ